MANRTKLTPEKEEEFLGELRKGLTVSGAAKVIKVVRQTCYEHRANSPEFATAWDEAIEEGTDYLEDEARRRAAKGTLKPVFYKGEKCGTIREYSDTLLIFLLKARRPEKFSERIRQEHSGPDGGPIPVEDVSTLTDEQRSQRITALLELARARRDQQTAGDG